MIAYFEDFGTARLSRRSSRRNGLDEADLDGQKVRPPTFEAATKIFCDAVESSDGDGKVFFGKEHILCLLRQDVILATLREGEEEVAMPAREKNPTYLPDNLIKTFSSLFVIRHPLLVMDSAYRGLRKMSGVMPEEEDFEFQCTMK